MLRETFLVFAALFVLVNATTVEECKNGGDANQVQISGCEEPPCKLKRRTEVTIEQTFTANRDIQSLVTAVNAGIVGVRLPFFGVDGVNACDQIYNVDGTKAGCPLQKGKQYHYKNSFPILSVYPLVKADVYYALMAPDGVVTCFEVASKIVD